MPHAPTYSAFTLARYRGTIICRQNGAPGGGKSPVLAQGIIFNDPTRNTRPYPESRVMLVFSLTRNPPSNLITVSIEIICIHWALRSVFGVQKINQRAEKRNKKVGDW
jgi:hypothetical protein